MDSSQQPDRARQSHSSPQLCSSPQVGGAQRLDSLVRYAQIGSTPRHSSSPRLVQLGTLQLGTRSLAAPRVVSCCAVLGCSRAAGWQPNSGMGRHIISTHSSSPLPLTPPASPPSPPAPTAPLLPADLLPPQASLPRLGVATFGSASTKNHQHCNLYRHRHCP